MFFFDLNFMAQLCGASSLNAVILPKEIRLPERQGGNEALHKDLRKSLAAKDLSRKGYDRLISAYLEDSIVPGIDTNADFKTKLNEYLEMILSEAPGQIALSDLKKDLRDSLPENLPPKTCDYFCELTVSSLSMQSRIEKEGPSALLRIMDEADDPDWGPFFSEMARRLKGANEVPSDVSASLKIMFGLSLFVTLFFEVMEGEKATLEEQKQRDSDNIKLLFAVENDQAYPQRAVARLLKESLDHSGCKTIPDFIEKAFGASGPHDREIYKFFAGTEIPTFEQTKSMYRARSLSNLDEPKEDDLRVMIMQFMARSYRHLNERLDISLRDDLKPHVILFKQLNSATQARPNGEPASMNASD